MRREDLKELTEDEMALLWYIVNEQEPKANPQVSASLFPALRHGFLDKKIREIKEDTLTDDGKSILTSLKLKIGFK